MDEYYLYSAASFIGNKWIHELSFGEENNAKKDPAVLGLVSRGECVIISNWEVSRRACLICWLSDMVSL